MIENSLNPYSPDSMSIELLPSYGHGFQQQIADVSDIIYGLQQDGIRDTAADMLRMAAEQMKICSLSEFSGKIDRISLARILDRADEADREAERISAELRQVYISLCKENVLLDTLKNMTESCSAELSKVSGALEQYISDIKVQEDEKVYSGLVWQRINDLKLSQMVAARSLSLIKDMTANNSILLERINSLRTNTLVLWRANISALKSAPDAQKLEQVCGTENAIAAAITGIVKNIMPEQANKFII